MKELYVSFDVGLLAKEKGFKEPCIYHYKQREDSSEHGNIAVFEMKSPFGENHNQLATRVSAPFHQQLILWLLSKHNIYVGDTFRQIKGVNEWDAIITDYRSSGENTWFVGYYKSYTETINKAFKKAFSII